MKSIIALLATLSMGALTEALSKTVAEKRSGVGGNVAGSAVTIPTQSPVPFNQSCSLGTFFLNQTILGVYCNNDNWTFWDYDWTWIDLNVCVGNSAGTLVPSASGTYASNCVGCNVTWSHVLETPYNTTFRVVPDVTVAALFTPRWDDLYLSCSGCHNGVGTTMMPSELDLNQVLLNNNGSLGCFNSNGSTEATRSTGKHHTVPIETVWSTHTQTVQSTHFQTF